MNASELRHILESAFTPLSLDIIDQSAAHAGHAGNSGGGYYKVTLISAAFEGKSRVARHQMVYKALDGKIGREIHALSLTALAPGEGS